MTGPHTWQWAEREGIEEEAMCALLMSATSTVLRRTAAGEDIVDALHQAIGQTFCFGWEAHRSTAAIADVEQAVASDGCCLAGVLGAEGPQGGLQQRSRARPSVIRTRIARSGSPCASAARRPYARLRPLSASEEALVPLGKLLAK